MITMDEGTHSKSFENLKSFHSWKWSEYDRKTELGLEFKEVKKEIKRCYSKKKNRHTPVLEY